MAEASETPARTQEYVERDRACMGPTARIPYYDLVVDHARGALLYDVEGNEYIDLLAAATSANVGHSHPAVVEAICGQAQKVIQCSPAYSRAPTRGGPTWCRSWAPTTAPPTAR